MRLKRHKQFIKDFKKIKLTDDQFAKLVQCINCLMNGKPLPEWAKDHELKGDYSDCREFHIGGDRLVIYLTADQDVILLRIGSHAQLFDSM